MSSYNPMSALMAALNPGGAPAPITGLGTGLGDYGVPAPLPSVAPAVPVPMDNYTSLGSVMPANWGTLTGAATAGDGVSAAARPDWASWDGFFGKKLADGTSLPGWGGTALGIGQGLLNGFMGMQQYGLMKDQLAESKRQYEQNYTAQRTTTNSRLEDRQRARVASNPGAYQSVGDYMNQNGVK